MMREHVYSLMSAWLTNYTVSDEWLPAHESTCAAVQEVVGLDEQAVARRCNCEHYTPTASYDDVPARGETAVCPSCA